MADITIQAAGTCENGTGTITGNWNALSLQNATVTVYGTGTSNTFTQTYTGTSGGPFTFPSLANDLYEVSVTGSEDGVSNVLEINISCSVTPPPAGCDLELIGMTLTPKTSITPNGTATIDVYGSGAIQYSLDNSTWQTSNVFTGLDEGPYTVYIRKTATPACKIQEGFIIAYVQDFTQLSGPNRDWLPVELPMIYRFQNPDNSTETATATIEVSNNGVDFNNPVIAGTLHILPDSASQYTINPSPYLAALFAPGVPIFGVDNRLFKLYRIAIGRSSIYDGTGAAEFYTVPARCLYASVLTRTETNGDLLLSQSPTDGFNSDYAGIFTKVDNALQAVTNAATDAPSGSLPCPKNPVHLYWLNPSGGWQSWVFDGKHEYEDEVAEGVTWQDEYSRTHAASVGPVVSRVNVFSGHIRQSDFATIHSVRYAIRVYHKDGNVWREVIPDRGTFPKYKAGDKRREVNFSFAYSEPLIIQHA